MMTETAVAMRPSSQLLAEGLAASAMADTWAEEHADSVGMSELGRCPAGCGCVYMTFRIPTCRRLLTSTLRSWDA